MKFCHDNLLSHFLWLVSGSGWHVRNSFQSWLGFAKKCASEQMDQRIAQYYCGKLHSFCLNCTNKTLSQQPSNYKCVYFSGNGLTIFMHMVLCTGAVLIEIHPLHEKSKIAWKELGKKCGHDLDRIQQSSSGVKHKKFKRTDISQVDLDLFLRELKTLFIRLSLRTNISICMVAKWFSEQWNNESK